MNIWYIALKDLKRVFRSVFAIIMMSETINHHSGDKKSLLA
jgi:hypothetical protein